MSDISNNQLLLLAREMSKKLGNPVHENLCNFLIEKDPWGDSSLILIYKKGTQAQLPSIQNGVREFMTEQFAPVVKALQSDNLYEQSQFLIEFKEMRAFRRERGDNDLISVESIPLTPLHGGLKIFISYSAIDGELANELSTYLQIMGCDCFVAHNSIEGGKNWPAEINQNLDDMRIFIACITDNFQNSAYCHQECGYAVARESGGFSMGGGIKIIPLMFGDNKPEAMLQSKQGIKIGSTPIEGRDLAKIIESIQSHY